MKLVEKDEEDTKRMITSTSRFSVNDEAAKQKHAMRKHQC